MKNLWLKRVVGAFLVLAFGLLLGCQGHNTPQARWRMGWVTAWSEAGLIVAPLIHTDILQRNNLSLDIRSFGIGPQMNEAAQAGEIDIIPIGIVPAAILLSASDDWEVVGRLVRFKQSTVVSVSSKINDFKDLKGKSLAFPFGAGPHPYILSRLSLIHI